MPRSARVADLKLQRAKRKPEAAETGGGQPGSPGGDSAREVTRETRRRAKTPRKRTSKQGTLESGGSSGGLKKKWYEFELTPKKVKPEQLMNFSRQSSAFVRSGIPLLEALDVVTADASPKLLLTKILRDVQDRLRAGASFSGALTPHASAFPKYYLPMLKSAEMTGQLDDVLEQIATYMDRDIETRRKVKSAMTYPGVIGFMSVATVIILSVFVLPRFQTFFEGFDAELPLPTRMLMGFTSFMAAHGSKVMLGILALIISAVLVTRPESGKFRRDALLLRIPKVGGLIHLAIIERFSRVLSVMVTAGVALPDAIGVAADTAGNRPFKKEVATVRSKMVLGGGIAKPVAESKMFPPAVRQMVRVGESTGTLDFQLSSAATFYGRELEYKLKRFTDLFEPAMIIFMGLCVGFVAVALVSAMYGIFGQVDI
jgi:type IV pilus assembly protein PilC